MQFLIAIDQTLNTLIWLPRDGFGMADETLSARAYRLRREFPWLMKTIDFIFFWDKEHCRNAYISEVLRKHLPEVFSSYCNKTEY